LRSLPERLRRSGDFGNVGPAQWRIWGGNQDRRRLAAAHRGGAENMHFTVGFRLKGHSDRITIDAEDALIAALRVKAERPEAVITYVRHQNKRGDSRHPSHTLKDARAS
jgi:hypothetical protein